VGKARDSHVLARKNTGNYVVDLVDEDDSYALRVRYTGSYGSDVEAHVDLEGEGVDQARPAEMKEWLRSEVRGDLDVAEILGQAGYDQYTNPVGRRQRPARIRL
jgi:hypothetical protein